MGNNWYISATVGTFSEVKGALQLSSKGCCHLLAAIISCCVVHRQ